MPVRGLVAKHYGTSTCVVAPGLQKNSPNLRQGWRRVNKAQDRQGFTIIELLAVLIIMGLLAGFAIPKLRDTADKARVARAIGDIRAIQGDIMAYVTQADSAPPSLATIGRSGMLDPWGHPYVYFPFPGRSHGNPPPAGARRDRFLVPINSTYDLYSKGKDNATVAPLSGPGADDIVRGNDGGFIGLGSRF